MRRYPTASQRNRVLYRRGRKRSFINRKKRQFKIDKMGRLVHYFKRTMVVEKEITATGFQAASAAENAFQLDSLPNYADFTSLYDEFKICGIKRKFVFNVNSADSGTKEIPQLITVNDFNSTDAITNENQALEYASFKSSRLDTPKSRYYKPSCALTDDQGLMFKNKWRKCGSDDDDDHIGLKWAVDTVSTAGGVIGTLRIYTTAYIACRNPR